MGVMKYKDPDTGEWVPMKAGSSASGDGSTVDLSDYTTYDYVNDQDNNTLARAKVYTDEQIDALDFSRYATNEQLESSMAATKIYVNSQIANIDYSPYAKTEDIPTAVESALTEAKESGEFDGADGYTPVKGIDYWTEEDKAEVVANVLAAMPAAEGVGF